MASDQQDDLARLKAAARERWGDEWLIRQEHFADGDSKAFAVHTAGPVERDDVDGKVREIERLQIADGEVGYDKRHIRPETVVETLEREVADVDDAVGVLDTDG